ncbi:hypothetical protein BN946_scf184912.g25 [Trametes cinnabarina]|uniref:Uncharacterized protein n=1 Tax=Pycnoporus cinnabarinus TaxID=5643 RepID=A0A060STQ2_PYCCI|nr:hypothetical protein BN946_scf184912.g25 [Trametes cinnabarina]
MPRSIQRTTQRTHTLSSSGAAYHHVNLVLIASYASRSDFECIAWRTLNARHSTVFGTALHYCAIRILGVKPDYPVAVKARGCLHKLGGTSGVNVYDWDGNHMIPAELW